MLLLLLWKIDVHLISTLVNKSLYYYYYYLYYFWNKTTQQYYLLNRCTYSITPCHWYELQLHLMYFIVSFIDLLFLSDVQANLQSNIIPIFDIKENEWTYNRQLIYQQIYIMNVWRPNIFLRTFLKTKVKYLKS